MSKTAITQPTPTISLGILRTDIVAEPFRKIYGSYHEMFITLFEAEDPTLTFKYYDVINGEYPADIDECEAYLITGSKCDSFADDDWIVQLRDYVKVLAAKRKKLIGICFGHQLIAHALGGLAGRCDKGWGVGVHSNQVVAGLDLPWLTALNPNDNQPSFKLLVTHQDQILKLPDDATLLAGNDFCAYGAYFIGQHILCFQGHPEFSKGYARGVMEARQDLIEANCYQTAMDSFAQDTDHQRVARWILGFIHW